MTLKYPKRSAAQKRKEKLMLTATTANTTTTELPQYSPETGAWTEQQHTNYAQLPYTPQQYTVDSSGQYIPSEYYAYGNKSPLLAQQLSPTTNHHQHQQPHHQQAQHLMENCDWPSAANHEATTVAKPVAMTYTTRQDENNNNNHNCSPTTGRVNSPTTAAWTTEFTYVVDTKLEAAQHNGVELLPEYINYCEYDQQTGFPPSISSNASTLSSPTTSTDYNFSYPFDPLNSSMSNDGFDSGLYQAGVTESYSGGATGYEVNSMDSGIYSPATVEGVYGGISGGGGVVGDASWTTTDIGNIPYEPNFYPFANTTEKMMCY